MVVEVECMRKLPLLDNITIHGSSPPSKVIHGCVYEELPPLFRRLYTHIRNAILCKGPISDLEERRRGYTGPTVW